MKFARDGLAGLASSLRSDRGHCHGLPREMETVIEGLALKKPRPSMAAVHRKALSIAALQGWPQPSYRQIKGVVGRMDPAMVKMAHEGTKSYKQAHELLYRREAAAHNEVWQADHTKLNVWIDYGKGKARKPWF